MTVIRSRRWLQAAVLALLAGAVLALLAPAAPARAPGGFSIEVVSNRADLISGGDALVRVHLPDRFRRARVAVVRRGERRNVSGRFARRANGHFEGLIERLGVGRSRIVATLANGRRTARAIHNRPNGGPVFSGPQVEPWRCQESARDRKCNQPPTYDFFYRPASGGGLEPYDPDNPPGDVAMTTTDEGRTVPFIVRQETGYQNRDQYRIAVLFDPDRPWRPWRPQPGWNGKLLITHGSSCGVTYQAGSAPDVLVDYALERGYGVMSTALNHAGHNCNIVTQAESMVMAKERIVERYGPIRFTIGTGCSGGSLTQQQVANAYPGIYQGILPQCSYPDALSTGIQFADYHGMRHYFEDVVARLAQLWLPLQWGAVEGHLSHLNAILADEAFFKNATNPQGNCVPGDVVYHPQSNPGGVRCGLLDYMINIFGPRPRAVWSPMEEAAGRGFAAFPIGNVGVQYGLRALRRGQITREQFIHLNETIGGFDIDVKPVPERTPGDRQALRNVYRSGAINMGNNLDEVAIIDLRGPDPAIAHDAFRSWAMRARLEREHGHFRNHVIWFGHFPLLGDLDYPEQAFGVMDRWLSAVERDRSNRRLARKVVANRPAGLEDRCSQIELLEAIELPGIGRVCELSLLQTRFGTPRTIAGEGITTDIAACRLKPLRRTDYYPISFTDRQWARLEDAFPEGVCDFARPGIGQQGTVPWQGYQRGGGVVYGGFPLGDAPRRSGGGWTSPSFRSWLRPG